MTNDEDTGIHPPSRHAAGAFSLSSTPTTSTTTNSTNGNALNRIVNTRHRIEDQELGIWPQSSSSDRTSAYVPGQAISGQKFGGDGQGMHQSMAHQIPLEPLVRCPEMFHDPMPYYYGGIGGSANTAEAVVVVVEEENVDNEEFFSDPPLCWSSSFHADRPISP